MSTEILATKTIEIEGFKLNYIAEADYEGCLGQVNFNEQWERAERHTGGVTITNHSNRDGFFTPLQTSLAELSSDYAKAGVDNPSKAAHKSLQEQLERDSNAFEVNLLYTVTKNDIILDSGCINGTDYSPQHDSSFDHDAFLEQWLADSTRKDTDLINNAKKALNELLTT